MSTSTRRFGAAVAAVIAAMLAVMALAPSSGAAPYSGQATLSVNNQNPAVGGSFDESGSGFGANEEVSNTLHTAPFALTSAHTNANGDFSVTLTLPAGVSGSHTIVATGLTSGKTATISIIIGSTATGSGSSGGGGLASTGVAVLGIAGLGVVLLVGGGVMLMTGKRRKATV